MANIRIIKILILFLILIPSRIFSQENFSQSDLHNELNLNIRQQLLYDFKNQNAPPDSNKQTGFVMTKSPLKAVLLSAVLPGAGQFYNESYWKIPIIAGIGGYLVYEVIQSNNDYKNYADQYALTVTSTNPQGDQRLLNLREFYRDQRDQFYIYCALLYFVQLADAYVDAELYDFDVSDNIKFTIGRNDFLGMKINF
jgi:hypothetical protein